MTDRRTQDAVERALSDLIVAVACEGEADEYEIRDIAKVLNLYRSHRDKKPARQPRRRNVSIKPLPTLDELVGEVEKPAAPPDVTDEAMFELGPFDRRGKK